MTKGPGCDRCTGGGLPPQRLSFCSVGPRTTETGTCQLGLQVPTPPCPSGSPTQQRHTLRPDRGLWLGTQGSQTHEGSPRWRVGRAQEQSLQLLQTDVLTGGRRSDWHRVA